MKNKSLLTQPLVQKFINKHFKKTFASTFNAEMSIQRKACLRHGCCPALGECEREKIEKKNSEKISQSANEYAI